MKLLLYVIINTVMHLLSSAFHFTRVLIEYELEGAFFPQCQNHIFFPTMLMTLHTVQT